MASRYGTGLFAGALLLAMTLPAQAQIQDTRWLPFVGCWEGVDGPADAGLLCFRPTSDGVEMTSFAAGEAVASEMLAADGQRRPVSAEGCEGSESVTFSEDGRRAFTRTEFVCEGESRSGSGVMAIVSPTRWVDVRALEVNGETVSWVQAYSLVGIDRLAEEGLTDPLQELPMTARAARMAAAQDVDLDDVAEATREVDEEAVVAWLAAQQTRFAVDGDELVRLADGGMPESVIDVVVAVSYPERFRVEPEQAIVEADREFSGRRIPVSVGYRGYMMWDPFYGPGYGFGYSPFAYRGFGYGYGYGSFGYPRFGGYGYGYGYGGRRSSASSGARVVAAPCRDAATRAGRAAATAWLGPAVARRPAPDTRARVAPTGRDPRGHVAPHAAPSRAAGARELTVTRRSAAGAGPTARTPDGGAIQRTDGALFYVTMCYLLTL